MPVEFLTHPKTLGRFPLHPGPPPQLAPPLLPPQKKERPLLEQTPNCFSTVGSPLGVVTLGKEAQKLVVVLDYSDEK